MESLKNDDEELTEMSKWSIEMKMFSELAGPGSKTAERVVNLRASESQKPEEERICYDPYAVYFISPGILEWAVRNPEKLKEIQETNERILPGLDNSIIARENGYDSSKKSLFIMEGLSYFIPLSVIDEILSFIAENSRKGSCILFDHYPESVVDGTCNLEMVKYLHKLLMQVGEPLKFGIMDGMIEAFLMKRGFSQVHNVTCQDYKRAYFHGVNEGRNVCRLLNFVHAVVG